MRTTHHLFVVLMLFALLIVIPAAFAQGPPQAVYDALNDLSSRVGTSLSLGQLDGWRWTQSSYPDASLGCPQPGFDYAQVITNGYQITFEYSGVTYDYRAARDGSQVFLCSTSGTPTQPQPTAQPTTAPATTQAPAGRIVCPGALPARLTVSYQAVATDNGIRKNIRSQPTSESARIGQVLPGDTVDVVGGPECAQGLTWWQIEYAGLTGWVAEGLADIYWFEPTDTRVPGFAAETAPVTQPTATAAPTVSPPRYAVYPAGEESGGTQTTFDLPLDEPVWSVAWSPDGRTLGVGADSGILLYDLASANAPPRQLVIPNAQTTSILFSPDGTLMFTGHTDGTVRIWDVTLGGQRAVLRDHTQPVLSLAISANGTLLASAGGANGQDTAIRLWDVATRQLTGTVTGHMDSVTSLAFGPDGTLLASASADTTVRLWDVVSLTPAAMYEGHTDAALDLAFSADGTQLVSAGADGAVLLWDISAGTSTPLVEPIVPVLAVAYNPDNTLLVTAGGTFDEDSDSDSD
ncbi:MAG: SH3 domain-containing protein, partial [Chloroflexi bacterium]|nr:SH3 domain-containing protein [Chloroflexota bacterium]